MRAQCTICSDLYDGDENHPVAAITVCGHTFHDSCLKEWLTHSATCPQCRKRVTPKGIIHRLYFDQAEDDDKESPSKLQNEVGTLKASLRAREREKNVLEDEKMVLQEEVAKMTKAKAKVEKSLQSERSASASLQKELSWYRSQQEEALQSQQEAAKLREKLDSLLSVQTVIQGLEDDVQEMISNQSDAKQLAKWCAVLKKELSTKRKDCKQLKETVERLTKEGAMRRRDLNEKTRELKNLKEQLKISEEDLKQAEKDNESTKKKMAMLKEAIASPSGSTASSFANRLICESPAPMPLSKKPKLSVDLGDSEEVDLNITPDLFSPNTHKVPQAGPSPQTQAKQDCQEFGTQFIKFSKAGSNLKRARDVSDISNQLPLNMNIFRKPATGSSGIMKKGYNGLGGHATFIQPLVKPRPTGIMKKVSKPSAKMRNLGPAPALPTLNLYDS